MKQNILDFVHSLSHSEPMTSGPLSIVGLHPGKTGSERVSATWCSTRRSVTASWRSVKREDAGTSPSSWSRTGPICGSS